MRIPIARLLVLIFCALPALASAAGNPFYDIDPAIVIPSKAVLLPAGISFQDTVPDTLDLAERASWFIHGATQSVIHSKYDSVANVAFTSEGLSAESFNSYMIPYCTADATPCLGLSWPNQGKLIQALELARRMSGYDRSDSDGTLSRQFSMTRSMLDYEINNTLRTTYNVANIVAPTRAVTPSTIGMDALITLWQDHPSESLEHAINEFLKMHRDQIASVTDPQGQSYNALWSSPVDVGTSDAGYLNRDYASVFINGRALRTMEEWYLYSGKADAASIGQGISVFLRNFDSSRFWRTPDAAKFPPESGQFVGHIHSWLLAVQGFLAQAETIRQKNPESEALAQGLIDMSERTYNFLKSRNRVGLVGDFGEIGGTGDMIRIGIKLSELGAGDYWDEVEAWTRNQLVDAQIDDAAVAYFPDRSNPRYELDHVAQKTRGLFFSDAAHIAAIPNIFNASTINIDGPANAFRAMFEVWEKTVVIKGGDARINFLLNRAHKYLDVKSDLPYRGRIAIDMKAGIGPITSLSVRIPNWTDSSQVVITKKTASGAVTTLVKGSGWSWSGTYARISNIEAGASYVVSFPIKVYTQTLYQLRSQTQGWYEGNYVESPEMENVVTYQGTFRGNTLVNITPRPNGGIPRYQRQTLAALPATGVAPPTRSVQRFVMGGLAPIERASCTAPWGATILDGQSVTAYQAASVPAGQQCVSETRACSNGMLSGSYHYQSCSDKSQAKFSMGDRIKATANLNIRATPSTSGTLLGSRPLGSLGIIEGGPSSGDGYTWWKVKWDALGGFIGTITGWSAEDYLQKVATAAPPVIPGAVSNLAATCSADGAHATLSWNAASGATSYHLRVNDPSNDSTACEDGWYCANSTDVRSDNYPSMTYSASVTPGKSYRWWLVPVNAVGEGPTANGTDFVCTAQTVSAPVITSENNSDPKPGESVIITGTGFIGSNDILLDGNIVQIVGATEGGTKLLFIIPTNYPTGDHNYALTVRNQNGVSNTRWMRVRPPNAPVIISENNADPNPGQSIIISGIGFTDRNDILLDGTIVQIVGATDAGTKLLFVIPSNFPTGDHNYALTVKNQNGTSNARWMRVRPDGFGASIANTQLANALSALESALKAILKLLGQ